MAVVEEHADLRTGTPTSRGSDRVVAAGRSGEVIAPAATGGVIATPAVTSVWIKRLRSAVSAIVGLALFGLSLWVLSRWLGNVSLAQLAVELAQISVAHVILAMIATALSFLTLCGYEFYAVRFIGKSMATPRVMLYAFITQSVAHAVGFAIFVGATIRYKLYAPHGFVILDIAKIQVFFTTTFGLGALTLIGAVLLIEPGPLVHALLVPHILWRLLGLVILGGVVALVVTGGVLRRSVSLFGWRIELPNARITIIQIILGVVDLLAVAAALHFLLPPSLGLHYTELLGIFVAAVTVGLVSHIPGSLGVFESAVILLIQPTDEQTAPLVGALIAYRAIYYILPLILGAILFCVVELSRWARPGAEERAG